MVYLLREIERGVLRADRRKRDRSNRKKSVTVLKKSSNKIFLLILLSLFLLNKIILG